MDRHRERMRHAELIGGIISSTVANFGYCRPEQPLVPRVFMPHRDEEKPAVVRQPRLTRKRRLEIAMSIKRAFHGHR